MKISNENISAMLKEARKKKGLSQYELADRVGKKRSYIARVETEYAAQKMNIQTLRDIVEKGFGGEVKIEIKL